MEKSHTQSDLKYMNYRLVFDLLRREGYLYRPDITKKTEITPPTVLKIINTFLKKGIIAEERETNKKVGRTPVKLSFAPSAVKAIGVIYDGTSIKTGLADLEGKVDHIRSVDVAKNTSINEVFDIIVEHIESITTKRKDIITEMSIAIPGVVDTLENTIDFAPLIGIENKFKCDKLYNRIYDKTGLRMSLINDANATALGEYWIRKLDYTDDLLYVSLGTGIGAGIILNGELRTGKRNMSGELGYTSFDAKLNMSQRESGWLESKIGIENLESSFGFKMDFCHEVLSSDMIDHIIKFLAPAISNLIIQLDVYNIVIGGPIIDAVGDKLFESLKETISHLCIYENNICRSLPNSSIAGAAIAVLEKNFQNWIDFDQ